LTQRRSTLRLRPDSGFFEAEEGFYSRNLLRGWKEIAICFADDILSRLHHISFSVKVSLGFLGRWSCCHICSDIPMRRFLPGQKHALTADSWKTPPCFALLTASLKAYLSLAYTLTSLLLILSTTVLRSLVKPRANQSVFNDPGDVSLRNEETKVRQLKRLSASSQNPSSDFHGDFLIADHR
jgi:hypothetical protein